VLRLLHGVKTVYLRVKGRTLQVELIPVAKANILALNEGLEVEDITPVKCVRLTIYCHLARGFF
jgi:hypothetical protein